MTVRAVEWKNPYTWGIWIEVTEDKVINLRLRWENNLIEYDEGDNEIYVDLQLDDEITPTDELPVWITTGRIIVDNWWDFTGTIIVAKTTSGDLIKFVYADDWKFYIDNWTWTLKQIYLKSDIDTLINALKVEIKAYVDEHDTVVSDTAPSDPYQWQLWYDTTTNKLKTYDWTQWNEIAWWATYSAWAWISIDQNNQISNSLPWPVIASSAPSNPVEWTLWYDTTNDVLKSYDGTQWNNVWDDNPNVKAFYITTTWTSLTAKEQWKAVLDWYLAGKTPIIIYNNKAYNLYSRDSTKLQFLSDVEYTDDNSQWYTTLTGALFVINCTSFPFNTVSKTEAKSNSIINVLRTGKDYSTPYTPEYNGSPATKKYVDDSVSVVSGDSGTTYTIKVSNTAPAVGTPNTTLTFVY